MKIISQFLNFVKLLAGFSRIFTSKIFEIFNLKQPNQQKFIKHTLRKIYRRYDIVNIAVRNIKKIGHIINDHQLISVKLSRPKNLG